MLKVTAALLTLVMLTGCETFVVDKKVNTTIVSWFVVEEVTKTCNSVLLNDGKKAMHSIHGCAVWNVDYSKCTIITGITTTEKILGHELRHCFEGHFHPQQ